MSHIVTVQKQVRDAAAVVAACANLRWKNRRWEVATDCSVPRSTAWQYSPPIGVIRSCASCQRVV